MGEADPKKSASPVNTTLFFTLVTGFSTSTSAFNLGIVSKKSLNFKKFSCGKLSKKSFNSLSDISFAG